jgi:hypothetical protein
MARKIEPYDGAVFWIPALILSRFHMLICSSSHMGSQELRKYVMVGPRRGDQKRTSFVVRDSVLLPAVPRPRDTPRFKR